MREFGAVGERELHGSASGDVEAGVGLAAEVAHLACDHVHVDGDERVGGREFGIDVVVGGAVFVARDILARDCALGRTGKSLAFDHHLAAADRAEQDGANCRPKLARQLFPVYFQFHDVFPFFDMSRVYKL